MDNDFKNSKEQKSFDQSSTRELYFEVEVNTMDIYKERMRMARKYGSRKKYATDQRLDESTSKPKSPPDGYIFDR